MNILVEILNGLDVVISKREPGEKVDLLQVTLMVVGWHIMNFNIFYCSNHVILQ